MIQIMDILHKDLISSNTRSGIGVNTCLCVAAHLKCMLIS